MGSASRLASLPTIAALESLPVLEGARRGASLQISSRYLDNRISVLTAVDAEAFAGRLEGLRRSRRIFADATASVDAVTVDALVEAGEELQGTYLEMPEAARLDSAFPGDTVVVPELLGTGEGIRFGARVYFFLAGDGPDAREILRRNAEAVVNDERSAFERYKGRLHGYPECCVEHFVERATGDDPPEVRSVRPIESAVRGGRIGTDQTGSIAEIVPDLLERSYAYAFFSRAFFPHPGCEAARERGTEIHETLVDEVDGTLARDYVRLNCALAYVVAANTGSHGKGELPPVGTLGTEQSYLYLPLAGTLSASRYS